MSTRTAPAPRAAALALASAALLLVGPLATPALHAQGTPRHAEDAWRPSRVLKWSLLAVSAGLLAIFRERGVPCAPINSYSQVLADPQVKHMQWVAEVELPNGVRTRTLKSPQHISGRTLDVYRRPPALGEHTAEVLAELEAGKRG